MEPEQNGRAHAHVDWPSPTLPIVSVAFKGPRTTMPPSRPRLDALAYLAFSNTSDLYQKLVYRNRRRLHLWNAPSSVDPRCSNYRAVKKAKTWNYVRDRILETVKAFQEKPVDPAASNGAQAPALPGGAEHGQQRLQSRKFSRTTSR
jgi:zinc protease